MSNRYKDVTRSILAPNHVRTRTWSYLAIPIISRLTLVDSQHLITVEISHYGRLQCQDPTVIQNTELAEVLHLSF